MYEFITHLAAVTLILAWSTPSIFR